MCHVSNSLNPFCLYSFHNSSSSFCSSLNSISSKSKSMVILLS
nr:MAG TPA: hypothetical protein [Bacteriophage sp.]